MATAPAPKGLTRAIVTETAAALVDADGWRQLTMSALARKLGVRGPSLYSHVGSLESLLGDVQVMAHGILAARMQRAAAGRSGEQGFRALAQALRSFASEHPGLYDLALSEPVDEAAVRAASEPSGAALLAVIRSFGIDEVPWDLVMNCLATLHGVIALDRARLLQEVVPEPTSAYERAISMVVDMLGREGSSRPG